MDRTLYSSEHKDFGESFRAFLTKNAASSYEQWERDGIVPRDFFTQAGRGGFLALEVEEQYEGAGVEDFRFNAMLHEVGFGMDLAGAVGGITLHNDICLPYFLRYCTKEQKQRWLPRLQSGEAIGCFGLTEPGFGSNPAGMKTTGRRQGDCWVLDGEKTWITNGTPAAVAVVWARTDDGIRGFLVEKGTPGFTTSDIHGKWSMRASVTSSLAFSDCRIPASNMLPGAKGLKGPLACLSQARYGIGWGVIGAAMDCYETARQYSIVRKQFDDRPIASHQLVQEKLAWMITEITKAQLLALHAGRLKDQGRIEPAHISMLKRNNATIALECARLSRDLLGANGITDEYPIMRHLCNLETVKTYEGTDHIHALVIGERITGIAAYR